MTNYQKGRRKEYKVVNDERNNNRLAFRSAGSHSPFDVISIDKVSKVIRLIQCKRTSSESIDYINPKLKQKLEEKNKDFNGTYLVVFEAR